MTKLEDLDGHWPEKDKRPDLGGKDLIIRRLEDEIKELRKQNKILRLIILDTPESYKLICALYNELLKKG